jgi:transposase
MRDQEGLFEVEPAEGKQPPRRATAVHKTFRAFDPHQVLLLPPSLDDWLPGDHLARFVADLVDKVLDLSPVLADYTEKRGFPPCDPRLMLRLLIYGYTTGVRSSRAIERRCVDDVAFRFLAAGQAPDFRSIARFRRRPAVRPGCPVAAAGQRAGTRCRSSRSRPAGCRLEPPADRQSAPFPAAGVLSRGLEGR